MQIFSLHLFSWDCPYNLHVICRSNLTIANQKRTRYSLTWLLYCPYKIVLTIVRTIFYFPTLLISRAEYEATLSFATTTTRQRKRASVTRENTTLLRPQYLNGVATTNIDIMQYSTIFWSENIFLLSLQSCRVPSFEFLYLLLDNLNFKIPTCFQSSRSDQPESGAPGGQTLPEGVTEQAAVPLIRIDGQVQRGRVTDRLPIDQVPGRGRLIPEPNLCHEVPELESLAQRFQLPPKGGVSCCCTISIICKGGHPPKHWHALRIHPVVNAEHPAEGELDGGL